MSDTRARTTAQERIEGILRAPRRRAYENLPLELIRDDGLSFRALGVLVRLLSNADNFRMTSVALANERPHGEGRDAVRAALRELEESGYIRRVRRQNSRGQWMTLMVVSEEPQGSKEESEESHSADFQSSVFQSSENRASVFQALKSSNTNKHYQEEKTTTTASALTWDALPQLSAEQRVVVEDQMEGLAAERRQDVLDELAGALRAKAIKGQWPGWLHGVVQKAAKGGFKSNHALAIQTERKQRIEARELAAKRQAEEAERKKRNTDPTTQARRKAQFAAIEEALRP